jgi:NodT family efflux transporter outer membrane factor (OMF) lipoprotein
MTEFTYRCRFFFTLGLVGAVLTALTCCAVGPDFMKPNPKMPEKWAEAPKGDVTGKPPDLSEWWTIFRDLELNSLIDRAVQANLDLQIAESRIREARAQRVVVAAAYYPEIDSSGSYIRSRTSENANTSRASAVPGGTNLFQAGFDASWEIDVFGGVRRAVEAATADIAVAEENRRDVLVTLLAEVARNYLEVRGSQIRLGVAEKNIFTQQQALEIAKARYEAGLSSELDVAQAQAQLATTEAGVPLMETSLRLAIHQLGILLGQNPDTLLDELLPMGPIPVGPPSIPAGLPSELLRRRPDIRQAEQELAAATARIGVATANLFPRFFLTGLVGQSSVSGSDFVQASSRYWTIGPTIDWPVFTAGRLRAQVQIQNEKEQQAAIRYERTVLKALKDVEDALVAYSKEQATRDALVQAVKANRQATEIANELYTRGLVDFLNVLVTQRAQYTTEDALAQSAQRVSSNLVVLFKALGGGWEVD